MARKRMIDPTFWTDEKLGTLTALTRLLFMGLISNADDEGRLPGHPALVKSQIFPYDVDITVQNVSDWLKNLAELDMIQVYSVKGQTYIQINNFLKYQSINRPTPSNYPAPQTENEGSLNTHGVISEDSRLIEEKRKEIEEKGIEEKDSTAAEVFKTFQENIHEPSSLEIEKLSDWVDDLGSDIVVEAIKEAVNYDKRSMGYINAVLNSWFKCGITTMQALETYRKTKESSKNRGRAQPNSTIPKNVADALDLVKKYEALEDDEE